MGYWNHPLVNKPLSLKDAVFLAGAFFGMMKALGVPNPMDRLKAIEGEVKTIKDTMLKTSDIQYDKTGKASIVVTRNAP